jgi:hypothetical protein
VDPHTVEMQLRNPATVALFVAPEEVPKALEVA